MNDADLEHQSRRFTTTEWSLVLAAAAEDTIESREALESLCRRYWYPVYAEVRFAGHDSDSAQDLTQGFFAQLLERKALAVADPDRGKFRNFLKTSIRNYLSDERAKLMASRRGGGVPLMSLDFVAAERQYAKEMAYSQTPETVFDRRWARALLERALDRLREEMEQAGSLDQFERLSPLLTDSGHETRYRELAIRWNTTEAAIKMAVHRIKRRLRRLGRLEVAQTVGDPGEIEEEVRFLLSAIGR